MRIRRRYVLPNGVVITLEHLDFALFTVSVSGKVLREFLSLDDAKQYMSRAIVLSLNYLANRKFKRIA